jgi:hypothetical protein
VKNKQKTYWPHMIVGFLFIGITLGFWTIKSASSMPVEKENAYMMSYQDADKNFNEIQEAKAKFDKKYTIKLLDMKTVHIEDNNNSRKYHNDPMELTQNNNFRYDINDKNGKLVTTDLNVSFLLTRPASDREDIKVAKVVADQDGKFIVSNVTIKNKGRYTLILRVATPDGSVGFLETPAYLK